MIIIVYLLIHSVSYIHVHTVSFYTNLFCIIFSIFTYLFMFYQIVLIHIYTMHLQLRILVLLCSHYLSILHPAVLTFYGVLLCTNYLFMFNMQYLIIDIGSFFTYLSMLYHFLFTCSCIIIIFYFTYVSALHNRFTYTCCIMTYLKTHNLELT